jgi:hypothetical protein
MSKKRKTRKQKELASTRHHVEIEQHTHHIHTQAPTYSVASLPSTKAIPTEKKVVIPEGSTVAQKDAEYLKHDMVAITAASGIVAAFDVLLFALLATGFLHLNFLGY